MNKIQNYTLNPKRSTLTQTGFSPVIIIIAAALVIILAVIAYSYFFLSGNNSADQAQSQLQTVPLTQEDPLQQKVGTPECPEVDYTGCDNTGDFMTWEDDGLR